jgi:ribosomal protein L11 methyltransferase
VIVPALQLLFPPDISDDERDMVAAALLDSAAAAVHEVSDFEWRVFFHTAVARDAAARAAPIGRATAAPLDIPDEDWARRSQEGLRSIRVGRLVIAPPWDMAGRPETADRRAVRPFDEAQGRSEPGERQALEHAGPVTLIVIEPSTGFGTGHHATTRLCLRALQKLAVAGATVLDVGTGSGVLAIAAASLGAAGVTAIDDDPDAIEAARANISRNAVRVDLRLADLSSTLPRSLIVMANLTGEVLRRNASRLVGLTLPGGHIIMSGILSTEADGVRDAFAHASTVIDREDEDDWASFTATIP